MYKITNTKFLESNKEKIETSFYNVLRQSKIGWGRNLTDDDLKQIKHQVETFYTGGRPVESDSLSTKCDVSIEENFCGSTSRLFLHDLVCPKIGFALFAGFNRHSTIGRLRYVD